MNQPWFVQFGQAVTPRFCYFISHVSEDAVAVQKLEKSLKRLARRRHGSVPCFLDSKDWQAGRKNSELIRDRLLESMHMLIWVTPDYLRSRRGWVWMELAFAELLDRRLELQAMEREELISYPFVVPVFMDVTHRQLARTPLHDYWQRGIRPIDSPRERHSQVATQILDEYVKVHKALLPRTPRR